MNKERELLARVLTSELWSVKEELQTEIKELLAQPYSESGMTLRDHFALAAMQAMVSPDPKVYSNVDIESVAKLAYQQANEMLLKRKDRNL